MPQMVKNLPATQETQVQSLGIEPLEEGMATHSSILAWKSHRGTGGLQCMEPQRIRHN